MFKLAFLIAGALTTLTAGALPASAQVSPLSESPTNSQQSASQATMRASVGLPEDDELVTEDSEPYAVRIGDSLGINVLEDPSLNRTALVLPDGRISMPIAGSIFVRGRSTEDIADTLAERLAAGFSVEPTVTVSVAGLAPLAAGDLEEPIRFYVMGAMNAQGALVTESEITLLEAIAAAGGPTAFAASDRIQLRRRDENGVETVFLFDFSRVEDGLPVENNVLVEEGDVIFAPERGLWD